MEIKEYHWIGIIAGAAIIIASLFFIKTKFFFLMIGVGIIIGVSPFMASVLYETKVAGEKEEMFLEFARNLVESVKVGTPISRSIINMKSKPYGVLGENVEKLANQISLGIPLNKALQTFSKDVNNKTISRALTLIGEAERAGGEIGGILEAVTGAVRTSDKLKKERRATISTLVVQGYIIFFIFIAIILIMQFRIIPLIAGIAGAGGMDVGGITTVGADENLAQEVSSSFLYLLLTQGFFSGLTIGKLSEGNVKSGIKHSFTLMVISFLVSSGANLFM